MWEKATGATLDWSEPNTDRRMKTPLLFDFGYLEDILVMPVTYASHERWELKDVNEDLRALASNWNKLTNTSGIFAVPTAIATNLLIDYVCTRNTGCRPWLDELCRIQPTIIALLDDPFTTAPALASKAETSEFQKPPMVLSRRTEVEWLSSHATELANYQGQWIAVEGSEIVAWGSDEVKVEIQAREKGIKVPLLVRIPSKDDIPFVGSNLHDSNNI